MSDLIKIRRTANVSSACSSWARLRVTQMRDVGELLSEPREALDVEFAEADKQNPHLSKPPLGGVEGVVGANRDKIQPDKPNGLILRCRELRIT